MFKVLVVVLVVVIVILVSVLYLQHQGKETVAQLKQLRQGINEKEIVDQLHKLDEANLSGRTKEAAKEAMMLAAKAARAITVIFFICVVK